jgi:TetR/AcrR family transcriptional regulator
MSEPDTKARILAAAEAEFLAGGYDRARMQAIADRAQINKAMLHYHFRSKGELFAQFFKNKAGQLFPKMEASMHLEADFIGFTCKFIDSYFGLLVENPYLPTLLLQVAANHEELLDAAGIDFPKKFVRGFKSAVKKKTITPLDPQQFIVSIMGMCVMPFVGKNLIKNSLGLSDVKYAALLKTRADEIKRYVVLLLTPAHSSTKESSHA